MKNLASRNLKVIMTMIAFFGVYLLSVEQGFAQDLGDFASGVEDNADTMSEVFRTILRVILGAGVIGVVWGYVFNNQKAKDNLIYFIIAIALGGIGELWIG